MTSIAKKWAEDTIVGYLLLDSVALRVRRVNSSELARVGYADLEGSEAYRAHIAQSTLEARQAMVGKSQFNSEEERAAAVAKVAEVASKRNRERFEVLAGSESGNAALLARADAYLLAAVDGAAELPEAHFGVDLVYELPHTVTEWAPWRFVPDAMAEDVDAGRVALARLPETTRQVMGLAIQGALSGVTRRRVGTFPHGA
jgi:hypothetical protein